MTAASETRVQIQRRQVEATEQDAAGHRESGDLGATGPKQDAGRAQCKDSSAQRIASNESKLLRSIDEKCAQVQGDINEERAIRLQNLNALEGEMKDLEEDLIEQIETEKARGQEGDRELLVRLEEETNKFKRELLSQTESREACESEIYELMKNVVIKIKEEIEVERSTREGNQEQLLNLLEDTCQKIEVMANQA